MFNNRGNRSYSQRKRMSMDYREEYFAHNPGLFGCIWTCAYCHAPILGRHNVEVDHIVPLNSPLGFNKRFNLVAACTACNRAKSDSVDFRCVRGYTSKLFEVFIFTVQKLFILGFVGVWWLVVRLFGITFGAFQRLPAAVKIAGILILAAIIWFNT